MGTTKKRLGRRLFADTLAEREGFEPSVRSHVRLISSFVRSPCRCRKLLIYIGFGECGSRIL